MADPFIADPIRLYFDEDAQRNSFIRALRARQFDVLTANEYAQLVGVFEQLALRTRRWIPY